MPRVLPSDVCAAIQQMVPGVAEAGEFYLGHESSAVVAAILDLVDRVPEELTVLPPDDYRAYLAAVSAMRTAMAMWEAHGSSYLLQRVQGFGRANPVSILHSALSKCKDEAPPHQTLRFIQERDRREQLRRDIGEVERANINAEWKAATVLAGSVIEALLLWAIEQHQPDEVAAAVGGLKGEKAVSVDPESDPKDWHLPVYIKVARRLGELTPTTAEACELTKDFRNLIHPGRAQRLEEECNRSTAYTAVAALDRVLAELEAKWSLRESD